MATDATDAVIDQTPPPPTTDTPPAAPPAPTPAELDAKKADFMDRFVNNPRFTKGTQPERKSRAIAPLGPPKDDPEPEPPATPPASEPPAAPATPPPAEPKPTPPPAAPPTTDDESDDEEARIEAAAARRMAEAGISDQQPPATPPGPPQQPRSGADAYHLSVLSKMEELNPAKYDGLSARYQEYVQVEAAYKRAWLAANPGKRFNLDEEEHNDWRAENEPRFSAADLRTAERAVERAQIRAEVRDDVRREIEPELQQMRVEREMQRAKPLIKKASTDAIAAVLSAVPEFEKAMVVQDGKPTIAADTDQKLQEINPVMHAVANEEATRTMTVVAELEKMNRLGRAYPSNLDKVVRLPNGETLRPHAVIVDTFDELEDSYATGAAKDRVRAGKTFIRLSERAAKIDAIQQTNITPAQKQAKVQALLDGHWTVSADDIRERVVAKSRNKISAIAKKSPASPPKPPAAVTPKNQTTTPPAAAAKPPSTPAQSGGSDTSSASDVADTRPPAARAAQKIPKTLAEMLLR